MSYVLDAVVRHTQDERPHPDLKRCINAKQKRMICSACMDICPEAVYDRQQKALPAWDACQSCGLCVTACRACSIAPSPLSFKRHMLMDGVQQTTFVACERAGGEEQQGCAAQYPWELLALFALKGRLVLDLRACTSCKLGKCRALLEEQLSQLRLFLGEARFARHVALCHEENEAQGMSVDRRGFFKSLAMGGRKTGFLLADEAAGGSVDGLVYRRMLASLLRRQANADAEPWRLKLPWFSQKCYGCGLCAKLCPNDALTITGEKDGLREILLDVYRCTGCGVCQAVCLDGGIEDICAVRVPSMDRVRMAEVKSGSCAVCGRAIRPDSGQTLCAACKIKKKKG